MLKYKSLLLISGALIYVGCNITEDSRPSNDTSIERIQEMPALPKKVNVELDGSVHEVPYVLHGENVIIEGDVNIGSARKVFANHFNEEKSLTKASGNVESLARLDNVNHWPQGRIPYLMEGFTATELNTVSAAIVLFNRLSPVVFVGKLATDQNWVKIRKDPDVSNSSVGMQGGVQIINIKGTMITTETIIHEMGHCAGLKHEHSRSDRGNNISITASKPSILIDFKDVFITGTRVGAYDFNSAMHYIPGTYNVVQDINGNWKFGGDGTNWVKVGALPNMPTPRRLGTFSQGDIASLYNLYGTDIGLQIPQIQNTAHPVTHTIPYLVGGESHIVEYQSSTGNVKISKVLSSGSIATVVSGIWLKNWSTILGYSVSGKTYLLFYNRSSGEARVYSIDNQGVIISKSQGTWLTGWDIIKFIQDRNAKPYWVFYNKSSGLLNVWSILTDGTLGSRTAENSMSGYDGINILHDLESAKIVNGQASQEVKSSTVYFHNSATGSHLIQNLNNGGTWGKFFFWIGVKGFANVINSNYGSIKAFPLNSRDDFVSGTRNIITYFHQSTGKVETYDINPRVDNLDNYTSVEVKKTREYIYNTGLSLHNFAFPNQSGDPRSQMSIWQITGNINGSLIIGPMFPFVK